jgi:hypothetical protein
MREHERRGPVARMVAAVKVAPHAVLEHLGLADVNNLTLRIAHNVHPRQSGEFCQAALDMFVHGEHTLSKVKKPFRHKLELDIKNTAFLRYVNFYVFFHTLGKIFYISFYW